MNLLLIAIGGALGSVARYLLSTLVLRATGTLFPLGTFVVNAIGCFAFGLIAGAADQRLALSPEARAFLLIGILGGFTTFSSYAYESFALVRDGQVFWATINLAAQFARCSTTRVLVIDADFYRQSLTKSVAPDARVGLREALEEPNALAKFVVRNERLNLDTLPCPAPDQMPDAKELLGTVQMKQLLDVAREAYDLVIIEAPPMAAVVDYKLIARHCDGFILVVEWGKTSQRLVLECLSDASALLDRVLCVVLNKADTSALRSIEYYKGGGFHAYYNDQRRA